MKKIMILAGTRPEAIKAAPVYQALRVRAENFRPLLCGVGQHKEMLAQAWADFELIPDISLDIMSPGQSLTVLSARLFEALDAVMESQRPEVVLVQGDTATAQVGAVCAFYRSIPVGHIEAGLRSGDLDHPFPEEFNRRVISLAATWHFAPTEAARNNLQIEGVASDQILVTGNTVIDALRWIRAKIRREPPQLPERVESAIAESRVIVLITGHRRESFGPGFQDICRAVLELAGRYPEARFVYPVHLNPKVRESVFTSLGQASNVFLEEPLPYSPFVRLMEVSRLILTDSGGLQEEAPALGKPVLIMRTVTERPEGLAAGVAQLVGTDPAVIVQAVSKLMDEKQNHSISNVYGDGQAGRRIAEFLARDPIRGAK